MTMKDLTVSRPFSEDEYNELLRQAVAVIEISITDSKATEYGCYVFLLGDRQVVGRKEN